MYRKHKEKCVQRREATGWRQPDGSSGSLCVVALSRVTLRALEAFRCGYVFSSLVLAL